MGDIMAGTKKPIYGVGIIGDGKSSFNGKRKKSYQSWCGILERCYSKLYQSNQPTYIGCSISDEWKNYPEFESWFDENYIKGHHLDKDIILKGNKVYCKEYCSYVPQAVNNLLIDRGSCRGSLPLGVTFHKGTGKYRAASSLNGKKYSFGLYRDASEASIAYKKGKKEIIKKVALHYFSIGQINKFVYNSLINWKVGE